MDEPRNWIGKIGFGLSLVPIASFLALSLISPG